MEESRLEIQKRDQEILALSAKMKTLEEQHQDYQRHIMVLKESLCAKEEHYTMLQADVRHQHKANFLSTTTTIITYTTTTTTTTTITFTIR